MVRTAGGREVQYLPRSSKARPDTERVGGALAPRLLRAAHLGAAFVALPLGLACRRDEHERDAGDLVRIDHAPAARRPLVGWVGLGAGLGLGLGLRLGLGLGLRFGFYRMFRASVRYCAYHRTLFSHPPIHSSSRFTLPF